MPHSEIDLRGVLFINSGYTVGGAHLGRQGILPSLGGSPLRYPKQNGRKVTGYETPKIRRYSVASCYRVGWFCQEYPK